ncbi:hypothetical protein [uncultured Shewanella sp.]|uniref:hypothetical protein n=1 Tax=uncultured Shewanella sp. TaxID=173975 RepID=UPI00260BA65D|nr:hypothetical protein [uncultured Shewanella sp.]
MKSDDFPTPAVNVDGKIMIPNSFVDVESKPYGVTESLTNDAMSSCVADTFTNSSSSIDDSFSSFDSGSDSGFGSSFDDGF